MLTRRTFSKLALSLIPAAWLAGKVKAEPVASKSRLSTYTLNGNTTLTNIGTLSIGFTADIDPRTRRLTNIKYCNSRLIPPSPREA